MLGENTPSAELQERVFEVLEDHPLYLEAVGYEYCAPTIQYAPLSDINSMPRVGTTKRKLRHKLRDVDKILVVLIITADREPEPLSGTGLLFYFALHPETLEVLNSCSGNWRA